MMNGIWFGIIGRKYILHEKKEASLSIAGGMNWSMTALLRLNQNLYQLDSLEKGRYRKHF